MVQVLINEGGLRAVGETTAVPDALYTGVRNRRARIVRLLVVVDEEEGRSKLVNVYTKGVHLLRYAAGSCYPAAVSILLEAGSDETPLDFEGCSCRTIVGQNRTGCSG